MRGKQRDFTNNVRTQNMVFMKNIALVVFGLIFYALQPMAQLPHSQSGELSDFVQAEQLFRQGIYDKAIHDFRAFREEAQNVADPNMDRQLIEADYYIALASVKLNRPEAEQLILKFVQNYSPDPLTMDAIIEIADYYFNEHNYQEAYNYYDQVSVDDIPEDRRVEILFKKGYVLFNQSQYTQARGQLNSISNVQGEYYYPSNYYMAMSYYEQENYSAALPYFKKIEQSRRYSRFLPSYLSQIYYEMGDYNKVIEYSPDQLEDPQVQEKDKIAYVLGLSYIQNRDYELALPHLEAYSQRNRMTADDYYQLAFVRYKTGAYEKAISAFQRVSDEDNNRGQNANLYLADCYLQLDQRESARNAFANAARRGDDAEVAVEANFNYGKLSAEMGFDREAVNALNEIEPSSDYHREAQKILSDLFLKTRDYDKAISTIEKMDNPSSDVRKAYQKITFYKATQFFQSKDYDSALEMLEKSLNHPQDDVLLAQATFWKGDILHRRGQYDESTKVLLSYLKIADDIRSIPSVSSPYMANYTLGYNYFKQNNFAQAESYFSASIQAIRTNRVNIKNRYITQNIYGDALMRHGDCLFKANSYDRAISQYDKAIELKSGGFIYAAFQKAIILGLKGQREQKIKDLSALVKEYPNSSYADNALLEMGITYTEMGQLNDAVKPLNRLVTEYESTSELVVDALLRLGLLSYNLGDVNTALNYYKAVFDKNPTPSQSEEAMSAIEEIYVQDLSDPDAYVTFLEEKSGVSLGSKSKDSLSFKAAEAQYENGNYEKSAEAYSNYLKKFPRGIHALTAAFRMGESYLATGSYTDALPAYEKVIDRGPSQYYGSACKKAAVIAYNHTRDFKKATEYYSRWAKVAQSEEDRLEAQLGGLEAAYRSKNDQAVKNLSNDIVENNNASDDEKASAMFYRGKLAYDKEQWDQALNSFNEVSRLSDNKETAEARYLIARIYYLQNELDLAETLSREAYKESSSYPYWVAQSLILLSDVLVEKDDLFNAKAALEAVLENFGESEEIQKTANEKLEKIKALEDE